MQKTPENFRDLILAERRRRDREVWSGRVLRWAFVAGLSFHVGKSWAWLIL
jgi:hypothetical protein